MLNIKPNQKIILLSFTFLSSLASGAHPQASPVSQEVGLYFGSTYNE